MLPNMSNLSKAPPSSHYYMGKNNIIFKHEYYATHIIVPSSTLGVYTY